jgi:AraC family transcriptional regulator
MSLSNNRVAELWRSFMPVRNDISGRLTNDLISMSVYGRGYFANFNPGNEFEKWACAEVSAFENIPAGMEPYVLPAGLYAVFDYKGPSNDPGIFHYIFTTWLPASEYELDERPHFEVLGAKYKNMDADSEEEIWIPIKHR